MKDNLDWVHHDSRTVNENYYQVDESGRVYYGWYVDKLRNEIDRLNNVINELEKWLKEYSEKDTISSIIFGVVLNHLMDLKGENNEKD